MGQGILITGTDTGVGKTFVGCGLARELRRRGARVVPFKPAETGCEWDPMLKRLIPADAELLRQASGTEASLDTICPYRFHEPLAPWAAAQRESKEIDPSYLAWQFQQLASSHEIVIAETAGGILVPLAAKFHFGDLARRLGLPVLVVAASRLGVINHTLLTLEYLRCAGLKTLAVVLNHVAEGDSVAIETNERSLRSLIDAPLFVVPQAVEGRPDPAAPVFSELADCILAALRN
jgi:dethiobiotin synthetase